MRLWPRRDETFGTRCLLVLVTFGLPLFVVNICLDWKGGRPHDLQVIKALFESAAQSFIIAALEHVFRIGTKNSGTH